MSDIIDLFASEHFTLNSISTQRRKQVLYGLRRYETFLDCPIEEAADIELRAWLASLLTGGMMPSTVNWYQRMAMEFYNWAWRGRLISAEHLMRLRSVGPPRGSNNRTPRPYSRKELALLWKQLDAHWPYGKPLSITRFINGNIPHYTRIRKHTTRLQLDAIIDLALVCGLRRGEILALSANDIHWDNKYIVVHGKRVDQNEKIREVPYAQTTRTAVHAWLRWRALLDSESTSIWLKTHGHNSGRAALDPGALTSLMSSFGGWELHRLRHTAATERLRAGMPIEHLQRFLGHSTLQQTLAYAKLVRGDIHKSAAATEEEFQRAIRRAA
jgi:integrase